MNINQSPLECIEIEPNSPAAYSVIWLHGLGADGSDFVPIVPELKLPSTLPIRFVFPHAPVIPVTINNGYRMRAWYDITGISADSKVDKKGINDSINNINQLIDYEISRGIPSNHIILAGFSQGAAVALTTAIHFPQPLAGVIALSGYLPLQESTFTQSQAANQQTPIFIAHGTQDPIVPFAAGKMAFALLNEHHYPASWHAYPMEHSVCLEEIQDIGKWLTHLAKDK